MSKYAIVPLMDYYDRLAEFCLAVDPDYSTIMVTLYSQYQYSGAATFGAWAFEVTLNDADITALRLQIDEHKFMLLSEYSIAP